MGATKHVYKPKGTCIDLFTSRGPEVLFAGPAGTGKSRACLEKVHAMCLANPGMRALMVRKTAVSLTSTALVTYEEHVAKEHLANGDVKFFGGSAKEAACYRYGNGSTITLGGMDKPMKVMSSEYDLCYVQEATELTEEDWESITTRLRNGKVSFQQLIADANPNTPTHWLKLRCDKGLTKYIASQHEDNPTLFDPSTGNITTSGSAYMAKLDALTGVRYQRLRKGNWVAAEGLVYDGYNPAVHLYRHIGEAPATWARYWAIDFGFTNPFVWQCWVEDPDGRLYLYRELYQTRATVAEMAEKIKAATKGEPEPALVVTDHDAEGRTQLEKLLGIRTTAAHKAVTEGIQAVEERFKLAADGKPRIYICRDALVERDRLLEEAKKPMCTEHEIVGYIWDIKPGKPAKEAPVKEDDHGMDAMRYIVAQRDLRGRPRMRSLSVSNDRGWG